MEAIAKLVQDDPYLKQSAQERIADRRGRRANIAAKATPDTAIEVRRAEAAPRYVPPPKEVLLAKPAVDDAWIERQLALYPPLKKPWFYIEDELHPGQKPGPLIADIQMAVLVEYPLLTMNDLNSARRTVGPVRARQVAMYLAKILTTKSLPEIGRRMGGRDHTTILHGVRKITRLLLTDPELAAEVERIKGSLEAAA